MNTKAIIAFLILIVGLALVISYQNGPKAVTNQRVDQTASSTFTSKLKNQSTDNLPKSTEKFTELQKEITTPSDSKDDVFVRNTDTIKVNYRGWLASTGEIFDQSFNRGDSGLTFVVGAGRVISGWDQGVLGMKVGEIRRLKIPSSLGYGSTANGSIPADSDLYFDVELIQIVNRSVVTEIIKPGNGDRTVAIGDKLKVNYTGTLRDGTKFDSSYDKNQPYIFTVGQDVIEGWSKGVVGMKLGEIRKLDIPSSLGYKNNAVGSIPANSDLIFQIELLEFQ